jgi:hypothetical protein
MAIRGQLGLLGGALLMGALGGAAFVHLVSSPGDERTPDATARMQSAPSPSTERGERRYALEAPSAANDPSAMPATSDPAPPRESEAGVPLSDVLSKLESQYQENLRSAEREQTPPEPEPVPMPAQPPEVRSVPAEPAQPQQVVVLDVSDVDQVNVNPGTVNVTHVTENNSSGVAVSGPYPYYPLPYVPSQVVAYRGYGEPGTYPERTFYPPRGAYTQPVPVTDRGRRYDSMKPPPGPDSPMFPAHASASLGPIFGGLP